MSEIGVASYTSRERRTVAWEARGGLRVHAYVTVIVVLGFVASELPWASFPAAAMTIGVWFQSHSGVRQGDKFLGTHQGQIERESSRRVAARCEPRDVWFDPRQRSGEGHACCSI